MLVLRLKEPDIKTLKNAIFGTSAKIGISHRFKRKSFLNKKSPAVSGAHFKLLTITV